MSTPSAAARIHRLDDGVTRGTDSRQISRSCQGFAPWRRAVGTATKAARPARSVGQRNIVHPEIYLSETRRNEGNGPTGEASRSFPICTSISQGIVSAGAGFCRAISACKLRVEHSRWKPCRRVRPAELLSTWIDILAWRNGSVAADKGENSRESSRASRSAAGEGGTAHEGVANRTLLIGPAGGFYSACSEDIYPNCWSKRPRRRGGQKSTEGGASSGWPSAVSPPRWRTTLGDYLRGPQQNLRFCCRWSIGTPR